MTTMAKVGEKYGCGRAMWEYNADQNRFGTPEALMLMPYWTNNCIDSMEGLFFESSATTPYHFSTRPSSASPRVTRWSACPTAVSTSPSASSNLQMLGVRYYVAFSPATISRRTPIPNSS